MDVLFFVLLLLALVCFLASAFNVSASRLTLISLGLALCVAVPLIKTLLKL